MRKSTDKLASRSLSNEELDSVSGGLLGYVLAGAAFAVAVAAGTLATIDHLESRSLGTVDTGNSSRAEVSQDRNIE
jgi:hypothetical protein